ncbi:MAG: hypothetical protein R3246_12900 [Acidimicrobiia bacterium]|nr:hypothetical protein [Acidimicrobiia bacterium]
MNDTKSGPDRVLLIGAIVVGLIVVVAALVALTRSEPEALDPNSPEGTAQRYVQAVLDGDNATIEELLFEEEDCDVGPRYFGEQTVRARLVDSSVSGSSATVEVELIFSGGDPLFGGYGYEERAQIQLEMADGSWLVDSDSWPYFYCEVDR